MHKEENIHSMLLSYCQCWEVTHTARTPVHVRTGAHSWAPAQPRMTAPSATGCAAGVLHIAPGWRHESGLGASAGEALGPGRWQAGELWLQRLQTDSKQTCSGRPVLWGCLHAWKMDTDKISGGLLQRGWAGRPVPAQLQFQPQGAVPWSNPMLGWNVLCGPPSSSLGYSWASCHFRLLL